jgi:DNA integrity scanning protein DisA with diadenylate cyclase activity
MELAPQILETIFFKNSPLHDGAIVMKNNSIIAARVILPVSESAHLPTQYGLRHRAALGITEKTDAIVIVLSEQTGKIVYVKNGEFHSYDRLNELKEVLIQDVSE